MPRERKESIPISIKMDKQTYEKLVSYCSDAGQTRTLAIERAVQLYVNSYYAEKKRKK